MIYEVYAKNIYDIFPTSATHDEQSASFQLNFQLLGVI